MRGLILTSPQLSVLVINYGHQVTRELLDREGEIQSLETSIIYHLLRECREDTPLDFLKKNPQVKAFGFDSAETSILLKRILSLLKSFPHLRKLSLA